MKWANKEVKHYLALWLKERSILLVKRAFNIIKLFYSLKFGTNRLGSVSIDRLPCQHIKE